MRIVDGHTGQECEAKDCVATIGFFDGVHCGHRFLVKQVEDEAKASGLASLLVTFPVHPLTVLCPEVRPKLLTPGEEKTRQLLRTGVDAIALLDFTRSLSLMSAEEFMRSVLRDKLCVRTLIVGYDHHFGHDRSETFDDYVRYGNQLGIKVLRSEELKSENEIKLASSSIREALQHGDIQGANAFLGYHYYLEGEVVGGFRVGRKIGFPTANIEPSSSNKLIPRDGVYVVRASVGSADENCVKSALSRKSPWFLGMMNIGRRPTLGNGPQRTIEVHLLDFTGDIYSERIHVEFLSYLREERKFGDIEQLRHQLITDEEECRRFSALCLSESYDSSLSVTAQNLV